MASRPGNRAGQDSGRIRGGIFAIPSSLRRLFSLFPVVTYPPSDLPARSPSQVSRAQNVLYVFAASSGLGGLPSYNPTCLRWQTFLSLAGVPFATQPATNHASPTGVLPFLLPATSVPAVEIIPLNHRTVLPITATRLEEFALRYKGASVKIRDIAGVIKAEVYQSLLDTSIRNAWLHALYLCPENTDLLRSLYVDSVSTSFVARASTLHTLRRAAEDEILRSSGASVVDSQSIYCAAQSAFKALATVLGNDEWFFEHERGAKKKKPNSLEVEEESCDKVGKEKKEEQHNEEEWDEEHEWEIHGLPSLFDAAVFAYTHLLLDESMQWQDRRLSEMVVQTPQLVKHRNRILAKCWPNLLMKTD